MKIGQWLTGTKVLSRVNAMSTNAAGQHITGCHGEQLEGGHLPAITALPGYSPGTGRQAEFL
jgi:hypothetical protein